MNFEETVTEFLLFKEMDQSKKSRGYYKDLMIFYDYLKSKDVSIVMP